MRTSILRRRTTALSASASLSALLLACGSTPPKEDPAEAAKTPVEAPESAPAPAEPDAMGDVAADDWGDVPLLGLDGATLPLSKHRAPVTVIALWATWCKPCLEELPELDAYRAQLLGRGETDVSFIAVSIDDEAKLDITKETFEALGLGLPALLDTTGRLVAKVVPGEGAAIGLPQLVVLDSEGHISRTCGYERSEFKTHVDTAIAGARRGLGGDEAHSCDIPNLDAPAVSVKFSVPKKTAAELEAFRPELKKMVLSINPKLEGLELADVLADAEAQIVLGGMVEVPAPAGAGD